MGESVMRSAMEKLESLLKQHVVGSENLNYMIKELESMQVLLKDADENSEMDQRRKMDQKRIEMEQQEQMKWLRDLRHAAFDIEDLCDKYMLQHQKQQPSVEGNGSFHKIKQFFNKYLMGRRRDRNLAWHIQDIKARVEYISKAKEGKYNLATGVKQDSTLMPAATPRTIGEDDALLPEDDERPKENLSEQLVEEADGSLRVVSVFGVRGLGKTTLVKKVYYENERVRKHFDVLGWATLSQNYEYKDLLKRLILSLTTFEDLLLMDMETQQLKELLHQHLQRKRYLIVLDDICNSDAWEEIKSELPDGECGSRIIVTTRSRDIANASVENSGHVYELKPLSPKASRALFHKVAFRSNAANNNPVVDEHLKKVIRRFLIKCKGVPLAIGSIAHFLSTKDTTEWVGIYRDIGSLLLHPSEFDDLNMILFPTYNSYRVLPNHLKPYLLYFCLFPQDYVIQYSKLLRLWAADGFSCLSSEMSNGTASVTKEEVAKRYLDELIATGYIQVQDRDLYFRVKTCRIRNILREIVLIQARDQEFAEFSSNVVEPENSSARRLSVSNEGVKNISLIRASLLSQIRSFFAYGNISLFNSSTISIFSSGRGKLLKVLDLEGVHLKEFPGEVLTNLLNLRYLGINAETFSHPSSLGRLKSLETLALKIPMLSPLPVEILHLKCLRNLFGDLLKLPKGIAGMTALETLNLLVGYENIDKELEMLTQLRSLCLVIITKEDKNFALDALEKMEYLRTLYLRLSNPKGVIFQVKNLPSLPSLLQRITLIGVMDEAPHQILSLVNLTELKLSYSRIHDYAFLKDLQLLPKLVELVLENDAVVVEELHFEMGSFLSLRTLELHGLSTLRLIKAEERAMPRIQKISFVDCSSMENVPIGIEHLTTLKQIDLAKMASNLQDELTSHQWKADHSPTVKSFADEYDIDSSTLRSLVDGLDMAY